MFGEYYLSAGASSAAPELTVQLTCNRLRYYLTWISLGLVCILPLTYLFQDSFNSYWDDFDHRYLCKGQRRRLSRNKCQARFILFHIPIFLHQNPVVFSLGQQLIVLYSTAFSGMWQVLVKIPVPVKSQASYQWLDPNSLKLKMIPFFDILSKIAF